MARRPMPWVLGVAVGLALSLGSAVPAVAQSATAKEQFPDAEIVTEDGRTFSGALVNQTADSVVLRIAGIDTPFPRTNIASLEVGKTTAEEYADRKAALDESDPAAWYEVAYFLFDRGEYDDAKREVEALLRAHPQDRPAARLRALIDSRILLRDQRSEAAAPSLADATIQRTTPAPRAAGDALEPSPTQEAAFWLTNDDINRLRLWELPPDLAAAQPRIIVPRDVLDELYEKYSEDPAVPRGREDRNRFRARAGWEQLELIFRVRARDLYPRVQVAQDPPALQAFRGQLNPGYVVGYFREHFGIGQVPGLYLLRYRPNNGAAAFANFLSLNRATYEGEPIINRDSPGRSLLLQWGLPRDQADVPAPEIEGWRPFFTGVNDPRFAQYTRWIGSLYDPAPDYGIETASPTISNVLAVDPQSATRP